MAERVLIVDDDATITKLLSNLIEDESCEVVVAENGIEAIDRLSEAGFGLIFLDLRMPGGDGQMVIEHLAKHRPAPPPVVLVLSAVADENTRLDESVVTAVIRKPFDPHHIAAVVRRYLPGSGGKPA